MSTSVLVYDLDHLSPDKLLPVIERLVGLEFALIPTHSDRVDDRCLRLLFPLSREVSPTEFPSLWERAVRQYGIPADIQCRDVSRLYYMPRIPSDAPWEPITGHGACIDTALGQAPAAPTPSAPEPAQEVRKPVDMEAVREALKASGHPIVLRALSGEPLAEEGDRDRALRDACGSIAWRLGSKTPPEVLIALLRSSVLAMAEPGGEEKWLQLLEYKVARALEAAGRKEANERALAQWAAEESARSAELVLPPVVQPGDLEKVITEVNKHYFVLRDGGVCVGYFDGEGALCRLSTQDFSTWLAQSRVLTKVESAGVGKLEPLGPVWLKHSGRRSYLGAEMSLEPMPGKLNLWRGFAATPKEGDWPRFRELLAEGLCDGDSASYEYLHRWCAWAVQHPLDVAGTAIVMKGEEGTGKGMFARALMDIFGRHAQHSTRPDHVVGHFNGHLERCCLLFADEAFFAGDHRANAVLKGLVTEETATYESKGYDPRTGKSHVKVIIATNEWRAVDAGETARRWFILEVSSKHRRDSTYFGKVKAELSNDGLAGWFQDLLSEDLGQWHPRDLVCTKGLSREKANSLPSVERWLLETLEEEGYRLRGLLRPWQGKHPCADVYSAYLEWAQLQRGERPASNVWFGKAAQKLGFKRQRIKDGPWQYCVEIQALKDNFSRILGSL